MRIYDRALTPPERRATGPRRPTRGGRLAKPAASEARRRRRTSCSTGGWRRSTSRPRTCGQDSQAPAGGGGAHRAAARSPTSWTEKPTKPTAYILFRGEYDKRRDQVEATPPRVLPPMPADLPRNRLGLAQWLLRPEHPLTARVTVNRFWQEVFGTGLVRTSGRLRRRRRAAVAPASCSTGWRSSSARAGWDVKQFFKLLVTSATYRQASASTPEKLREGPGQPAAVARPAVPHGRRDDPRLRPGGQRPAGPRSSAGRASSRTSPTGVWEAVGDDRQQHARLQAATRGEGLYRRSLYTFWKRTAPPASMDIFNAPNRETCTVRRERTNTPLQALVTLNDPQFVEAARGLAERALKEGRGRRRGAASTSSPSGCCAARRRPRRAQVVQARPSTTCWRDYREREAGDAQKLIAVGESKADPTLDAADAGGVDDAGQPADEPGRGAEQVTA